MVVATAVEASELARTQLAGLETRWRHVREVGRRAEVLCRSNDLPNDLAAAAWLHDVGYGERVAVTGFHPLDGAHFLRRVGASDLVTSLVAYHSGAAFEAEERGLAAELDVFAPPPEDLLDALVLLDMTTSPSGERVSVDDRLAEIVSRYEPWDPVFRAVSRSGPSLREAAARAAARLYLADVRGVPVV